MCCSFWNQYQQTWKYRCDNSKSFFVIQTSQWMNSLSKHFFLRMISRSLFLIEKGTILPIASYITDVIAVRMSSNLRMSHYICSKGSFLLINRWQLILLELRGWQVHPECDLTFPRLICEQSSNIQVRLRGYMVSFFLNHLAMYYN